MKPTEFLREFDQKDSGEYNDEAGMALSNLETICRSARELEKHIDTEENLPEWCQEKLAVVKGMLTAVTDYMVSQDSLDAKQDDFSFNTDRIAEQLNSMLEGGPYDLPGIDYDRPGDVPRKPRAHGGTTPRRHNDDPDFMDPDQRRLRAEQERLKKAAAEKHKGVAEGHADQERKIFKKNGKPVGEVGIDRESSPGNGQWYMTCYGVVSYGGYDSYEEAVAELKHCLKQGVAEKITPPGKDDMEQYRKDTADMAKRAIANKTPMSKNPVNEFAGGMGAASVATAPGIGKGPKVGSLFGGSYAPKTPFNKKRKR